MCAHARESFASLRAGTSRGTKVERNAGARAGAAVGAIRRDREGLELFEARTDGLRLRVGGVGVAPQRRRAGKAVQPHLRGHRAIGRRQQPLWPHGDARPQRLRHPPLRPM